MQNWQLELTKKCSELNMELIATMSSMTIICPKMPPSKKKSQILSLIPVNLHNIIKFEEGPKPSTMERVKNMILSTGVVRSVNSGPTLTDKRDIILELTGNGNPDSENVNWSSISDIFIKDGYFDSFKVIFNGNTVTTYNRKVYEELQKNKFRDCTIRKDEITDLRILLETEMDFDKILERL